jgi:hypothetical protein
VPYLSWVLVRDTLSSCNVDRCSINVLFLFQELASSSEENPDYTDIELIQHINVDILRLIRLLTGTVPTL